MNNLFYKMMVNEEKDTIFINLTDEKYKNVIAKVGHIEYDDNFELTFDMELPAGYEKYYDDEKFINLIQNAVFDIVASSVQTYWDTANNMLQAIEKRLEVIMQPYNIKKTKPYVDLFLEKGYIISEENNNLVALNTETNKKYYFNKVDDFNFLKNEINPSKIII